MKKIVFLTLHCLLLSLALLNAEAQKPNIILLFIDDMGWADFSCFGNEQAKTPHIDALAQEGLAFEQFYVNSPICSPSRVAISTGQYPNRWGITSYLANRKANKSRGMANWLDPKAPMLARTLQEAGYATGHFGKWHMGGQRDVGEAPLITEYGFDESLTNFEGLGPRILGLGFRPKGKEPRKLDLNSSNIGNPQNVTWADRSKLTELYTDAALTFIKTAEAQQKPFYVNLWPDDVHLPHYPALSQWGSSKKDLYYSVLMEMDRQVSRIFDHIKSSSTLKKNTIILVCSDNGPAKGAGSAGHFKGYKSHLYEGGVRSPLIVWGPGFMKEDIVGSRNNSSVFSAIDLAPTLIQMANITPKSDIAYDGKAILDIFLGETQRSRSEPIFFIRPPDRKNFYGLSELPDLAIRKGKWKLLCDFDGKRPELYDLEDDPSESFNLAHERPEVVSVHTNKLLAWHQEMSSVKGGQ